MSIFKQAMRSKGFTLIELLVAISIIGLLIALVIPAVQASRSVARRMTCAANLKQIGLATLNYESTYNMFPVRSSLTGMSHFVAILPYIEQSSLFSSINTCGFLITSAHGMNTTAANTKLGVLSCPSDSSDGLSEHSTAATNYAGNVGYGFQFGPSLNGMFSDLPVTMASVRDGSSQTVLFAEWVVGSRVLKSSLPLADKKIHVFKTPEITDTDDFERFVSFCSNEVTSFHITGLVKGESWMQPGELGTTYNHDIVVNGSSCTNAGGVPNGAWTAGSFHDGIAQTVFSDGHVQTVRDTVNLMTWRALGTRAGNEVVDESGF